MEAKLESKDKLERENVREEQTKTRSYNLRARKASPRTHTVQRRPPSRSNLASQVARRKGEQ